MLCGQIDATWPHRDRGADGTIGDVAHRLKGRPTFDPNTGRGLSGSDHNCDSLGLVCAVDIDDNLAPGVSAVTIGLHLAASQDPRINYMEAENCPSWPARKRECSARTGWQFVDVGPSSAGPHLHVSFLHKLPLVDSTQAFQIDATPVPAPTPAPKPIEDDMPFLVSNKGSVYLVDGPAITGFPSESDEKPFEAKFGAPIPISDELLDRFKAN